ncbi:hypothetical protein Hanom_Chr00s002103g01691701 [Helianthus anomalus]
MHNFKELEKLKAIELPPYELDHVELKLDAREESSAHVAFVEAVLWCCRPQSLTLRSSVPFEEQSDVVKFTYKKLLEQSRSRPYQNSYRVAFLFGSSKAFDGLEVIVNRITS